MILTALAISTIIMIFGWNDMFRFSADQWSAAGRHRTKWILLVLGFGPLAVLLYWGTVRYDLRDPDRRES